MDRTGEEIVFTPSMTKKKQGHELSNERKSHQEDYSNSIESKFLFFYFVCGTNSKKTRLLHLIYSVKNDFQNVNDLVRVSNPTIKSKNVSTNCIHFEEK
jgi:hypothetical protein